jgi:hypothetical protein
MRNKFIIICLSLLAMQSCKPTAEGLFREIESKTGFELKHNPEGTDEVTSSVTFKVSQTRENLIIVDDRIELIISSYLDMKPTYGKKGYDLTVKNEYKWDGAKYDVSLLMRYLGDSITGVIFFRE